MKLKGTIVGFDMGLQEGQVEVKLHVKGNITTAVKASDEAQAIIQLICSRAAVKGYALGDFFEVDINQVKL